MLLLILHQNLFRHILIYELEYLSVHLGGTIRNLRYHTMKAAYNKTDHYENTPMQYTAIFHGCENVHFQMGFFKHFSYFCSKHRSWVHFRTASVSSMF